MSETSVAPQGIDPAAEAAKATAQKAAQEAAAAKAADDPEVVRMSSKALKERLDDERTKGEKRASEQFAKELGIPIDEAKRLIAEAKAKDDAAKSEVQKLTEAKTAAEAKLTRLSILEEAITARASLEYGTLSDEQKKAVDTLAGNDPAARLKAIDAMKPTWIAAAQAQIDAAKTSQEAAAKAAADAEAKAKANLPAPPVPSPANTAPAGTPPPAVNAGTPTNHLAVYESLKQSNPAAAAVYHNKHAAAILAARRNKG